LLTPFAQEPKIVYCCKQVERNEMTGKPSSFNFYRAGKRVVYGGKNAF